MKTSNKILVGLLVIAFTVPVLLAFNLKSKVEKGEYTIETKNKREDKYLRNGSITPFKVVKVVGPNPEKLTCKLKLSNKMSYSFYNETTDSIRVFNSGDTLFVQYNSKLKPEELREVDGVVVYINVPVFNSIIVDGASVTLDSLTNDTTNLNVTLKNKGSIKDGTKKAEPATDKTTSHLTGKKDDLANVFYFDNAVVINENKVKTSSVNNVKHELLDINIKDLLLYRLLSRG